jgi:hypothetical protein
MLILLPSHSQLADLGAGSTSANLKSLRTGRADIVQHRIGADLSIDSLNDSSHDEVAGWITVRGVAVVILRMRKRSSTRRRPCHVSHITTFKCVESDLWACNKLNLMNLNGGLMALRLLTVPYL